MPLVTLDGGVAPSLLEMGAAGTNQGRDGHRPPPRRRHCALSRIREPDAIATLGAVPLPAMAVLNRCALAVAPKLPMREWSRPFWTREDLAAGAEDESLYLIPAYDDDNGALTLLRDLHEEIFSAELDLWCVDRELWPSPRGFELFLDWFSLRFFPLVEDLGLEPLVAYRVGERFRSSMADALGWQAPKGS